jgi:electron transfer flavoprotein alpha subunit
MGEHNGILVFSENHDLMLEILGKAREIADRLRSELAAVLIGTGLQPYARECVSCGADKVYIADSPTLQRFGTESYLSILHSFALEYKPEIVLLGSTRNGKSLAARLATRLGAGCIPDCNSLEIDDQDRLVCERMTYGGNSSARIAFRTKPQIATVPARAFEKPQPVDRQGETINLAARSEQPRTETIETKPLESSTVRIEDAQVIVSCGRGLARKEDKTLLDDIAALLCGQVGCSRPLAEDRKWFGEWVGLSGHKVKPKLYISCGISGVIQHVAGIRDAKIIVAVNKDPEAPIFEAADYGVVGDLYEVLPALKEALKKHLK